MKTTLEPSLPQAQSRIEHFFNTQNLGTLLHQAGIRKRCGVSPTALLLAIFQVAFLPGTFFRQLINPDTASIPFGKSTIYSFLNNERGNWRRFLATLATQIISVIDTLTSEKRERVLILDDSTYERLRSKGVELLANVFDHNEMTYKRGFRMLTLGWSDGVSFLPLDFVLLSSTKAKNRFQEICKTIDRRTCGYKRRLEAMEKATDASIAMVKRAVRRVRADYVLMDSWFGFPAVIRALSEHVAVICMVKRMPKVRYRFQGRLLDLGELYQALKKRRGRAKILASVVVRYAATGQKVKVVFVRHRSKRAWLALVSTDTGLEAAEIVRIYGKRWDIEVFFKTCKQHLGLAKEVQLRDFDGLMAHTTIVMARYMFLSLEQRRQVDERTLGDLFYVCASELADLPLVVALERILVLVVDKLRQEFKKSEDFVQVLMETFMEVALSSLGLALRPKSES